MFAMGNSLVGLLCQEGGHHSGKDYVKDSYHGPM